MRMSGRVVSAVLGALCVGCAGGDRLRLQGDLDHVPPTSAIRVEFVRVVGGRGSSPGEFVRPSGVSVNALGQAYVVDTGNDRVQRLDPDGRYLDEIGGFGWGDGQFNQPTGITATGSLDVWVADTQNRRIVHLDATLYWLGVLTEDMGEGATGGLGFPTDAAVSPDGWLWFTDRDGDRLRRISPFGDTPEIVTGSFGAGDLADPGGLAVGPEGTIVVADTDGDRLVLYDRFGNRLRTWGEGLLKHPNGVEITREGDIVVADTGNDRIVFVNRLWKVVGTFGATGVDPGSFRAPADVAVDRRARMWVTDRGNHRVQQFRLERQTE